MGRAHQKSDRYIHLPASIIRRLGTVPDEVLAGESGVSAETIRRRRALYNIAAYRAERIWTEADDRIVKTMTTARAAKRLGVSAEAIRIRRSRLGIARKNPPRRTLTAEQREAIKREFRPGSAQVLAAKYGITWRHVYRIVSQ